MICKTTLALLAAPILVAAQRGGGGRGGDRDDDGRRGDGDSRGPYGGPRRYERAEMLDSACLGMFDEVGPKDEELRREGTLMSNILMLEQWSRYDLHFKQIQSLTVCAGDEYVHGVMATVHDWNNFADKDGDDDVDEVDAEIEENLPVATHIQQVLAAQFEVEVPVPLNFIGSADGQCQTMLIDDGVFINKLKIKHDDDIRTIEFYLSDDTYRIYGKYEPGPDEELETVVLQAAEEETIIGFYGRVVHNEDNPSKYHLRSFGAITDKCEGNVPNAFTDFAMHMRPYSRFAKIEAIVLGIIIFFMSLCLIYLLLKNRGKLCKKDPSERGPGASSVPNDSVKENVGEEVELDQRD